MENTQASGHFSSKFVFMDAFAEPFQFGLPGGTKTYQSKKGCCLTLFLAFVIILYGAMQYTKLIEFDETDVMVSSRDAFFDTDFVVKQNLQYAFGITAYDGNPEPIEDPTYGVLKAYYKTWGIDKSSKGVIFEELPSRACTTAELNMENETNSNARFFEPHSNSFIDLNQYHKKLKCLVSDNIELQGDFNSPRTRTFVLLFERCNNSTFGGVCKSDVEISKWLQRKFILINTNRMRFSTREFEPETKLIKESSLIWVPISSQLREEVVYRVYLQDLFLQDSYFQFSDVTEDEQRMFSQAYSLSRPYEFPDDVHLSVSFEFDLTLYRVDRDVYSILDWVGDVGGLNEGLYLILSVILAIS